MAKKVGEHITLDIIGTKKEYEPSFYEKLVYKKSQSENSLLHISIGKFQLKNLSTFF